MRLFLYLCFVAMVAELTPALAQDATPAEASIPAAQAGGSEPVTVLPPGRVGRISFASGNVDLRTSGESGWANAELNQPVFTGSAVRTDPRSLAEIEIGGDTIGLSHGSELEIANLRDRIVQMVLSRGRIRLRVREIGMRDNIEVDLPQGGVRLLAPGSYDIDVGDGDQPPRVAAFEGIAQLIGGGNDLRIEAGNMAAPTGPDARLAIGSAPDAFVEWCRSRDFDETRLAASYYVSPYMTGFAELDSAGVWKINPNYGPVWFPTDAEWAPYRFGHWSWKAPWGWTWIDEQPWGFAPSHYGRWALIDEHWAWVPGSFVERPVFAPAVVAFLGTPGVGLSSAEGAAVAWFPLSPNEVYWPSYSRDLDHVRSLNPGNAGDVEAVGLQVNGEPPLEVFNETFANREFATVIPRSVFISGRPAAPARLSLPAQRLQNAPVLMGSPQIAPASVQRVARAMSKPANAPPDRVIVRLVRNKSGRVVRAASTQSRGRGQPVIVRGAHLHAPSYAGSSGRQVIVLRVAHTSRGGAGRGARH